MLGSQNVSRPCGVADEPERTPARGSGSDDAHHFEELICYWL
jgi:hypothetical protein